MSADIGYSVALCTSTVTSCLVRRYRCSEIVAENAPSKAQRAEHDSDILAGVGMDGVTEEGVKVTESRRVDTLGGRLRWMFSWRWWMRMRCASAAIVGAIVSGQLRDSSCARGSGRISHFIRFYRVS